MCSVDPYKLLGVGKTASDEEIKKAYWNLAKQLHPDKNKAPDAEEKFKELSSAYDLIKDKDKRRTYDNIKTGEEERRKAGTTTFTSSKYGANKSSSHARPHFQTSWGPGGSTTFTFTSFFDDSNDPFMAFFTQNYPRGAGMGTGSQGGTGTASQGRKRHTNRPQEPHMTFSSFFNDDDDDFLVTGGRDPLFDSLFTDQLMDMSRLFSRLFGGLHQRTTFTDLFRDDLPSRGSREDERTRGGESRRAREATIDDIYDWSVPMWDRNRRGGSEGVDMNRIRFPCIYCGRSMTSDELSGHEEVCKRFYSNRNTSNSNTAPKNASSKAETKPANEKRAQGSKNESSRHTNAKSTNTKTPDHVSCPWCRELFNHIALDNHISACVSRRVRSEHPQNSTSAHFSTPYRQPRETQREARKSSRSTSYTPHNVNSGAEPSSSSSSSRTYMETPMDFSATGVKMGSRLPYRSGQSQGSRGQGSTTFRPSNIKSTPPTAQNHRAWRLYDLSGEDSPPSSPLAPRRGVSRDERYPHDMTNGDVGETRSTYSNYPGNRSSYSNPGNKSSYTNYPGNHPGSRSSYSESRPSYDNYSGNRSSYSNHTRTGSSYDNYPEASYDYPVNQSTYRQSVYLDLDNSEESSRSHDNSHHGDVSHGGDEETYDNGYYDNGYDNKLYIDESELLRCKEEVRRAAIPTVRDQRKVYSYSPHTGLHEHKSSSSTHRPTADTRPSYKHLGGVRASRPMRYSASFG